MLKLHVKIKLVNSNWRHNLRGNKQVISFHYTREKLNEISKNFANLFAFVFDWDFFRSILLEKEQYFKLAIISLETAKEGKKSVAESI